MIPCHRSCIRSCCLEEQAFVSNASCNTRKNKSANGLLSSFFNGTFAASLSVESKIRSLEAFRSASRRPPGTRSPWAGREPRSVNHRAPGFSSPDRFPCALGVCMAGCDPKGGALSRFGLIPSALHHPITSKGACLSAKLVSDWFDQLYVQPIKARKCLFLASLR